MKRRIFLFFLLASFFSGCIRLTGSAGVWKKGAGDDAPQVKKVGFDTADYVPGQAPGNIQMGETQ